MQSFADGLEWGSPKRGSTGFMKVTDVISVKRIGKARLALNMLATNSVQA